MDVICEMEHLNQSRPATLAGFLAGVSSVTPFVQHKSYPYVSELIASYGKPLTPSVREWSFPSVVDSIECRYIERWLPTDNSDRQLRLRHSYLHLYHHEGPHEEPREILAFHWEPIGDSSDSDSSEGIRRPHIHMTVARQPLGRSHLGVALTVPPNKQSNVDFLDKLLCEVIQLVRVEVLDRIEANPAGWR